MSDVISMTELELAMRKLANQVKLDTIEACAKIAEPWSGFAGADKMGVQDREIIKVRQEIAAAIRSLSIPSADREGNHG